MSNDALVNVELEQDSYRETLNELQALSSDLQEKAIKSSLRAAGKPLVEAMKGNAPDDKRTAGSRLERAINITQAKTGKRVLTGGGYRTVSLDDGEYAVVVGPNKKTGDKMVKSLAWMLEAGTKPHKIAPRNRLKNFLQIGNRFIRGSVQHPGVRPRRWMSKAYDDASGQVETAFYNGLEKWLDKYGR